MTSFTPSRPLIMTVIFSSTAGAAGAGAAGAAA